MALNFPAAPNDGDVYENYVWNATVGAWQSTFTGGGGSIEASSTAPENPSSGDLWWDTDNGNLYIYYDDGNSEQWVAANGPQVFVGTSAPAGYQGQLWFDSTEGKTYIYYDDGSSAQWVSAIGGTVNLTSDQLPAGSILQVVQERKVDQFSTSSLSYVDVTAWAASITPTSTSSKILILVTGSAGSSLAQIAVVSEFQLLRNATAIGNSADNKFYGFAQDANRDSWPIAGDFLDSPATTSEVTYQVQVRATGGTTYVNSDGAGRHTNTSSITLMEIAG